MKDRFPNANVLISRRVGFRRGQGFGWPNKSECSHVRDYILLSVMQTQSFYSVTELLFPIHNCARSRRFFL
jgi:hypothetical protein